METKPTDMTEEEWEEIVRNAGFRRIKARDYKGNFKRSFDQHWEEKCRRKPVIESKDIMEPLDTRIMKE